MCINLAPAIPDVGRHLTGKLTHVYYGGWARRVIAVLRVDNINVYQETH
jgi:hypothetical protein